MFIDHHSTIFSGYQLILIYHLQERIHPMMDDISFIAKPLIYLNQLLQLFQKLRLISILDDQTYITQF